MELETVVKGKITQIIKHSDKDTYFLPHEIVNSNKNVIVVSTKEINGIVDRIKCLFTKSDDYIKVMLSDRDDFKINETVLLKVKPYWVKTKFYEIIK